MSDSAELWGLTITDQDAEEFLKKSTPNRVCRACNGKDFEVGLVPPGGGEYLALGTTRDAGGPGSNYLPIFTCACQFCGLIEVYSSAPMVAWKASQGE